MIHKHSIPILEYDTASRSIINPDQYDVILPRRAVFAFLGDPVDEYAASAGAEVMEIYHTIGRDTSIYRISHNGEDLCLCRAPLGGSAAVQLLDFLLGHGVEQVIAVGSCGALAPLPENAFLLPVNALRDEGTSYHYLPPARYAETSPRLRAVLKQVLGEHNLSWAECTTWTTDGFYRETEEMVAYRREEGCQVVEMECASMAACASFRDKEFAQLLYTADSLADAAHYDARDWGKQSVIPALMLCMDAAAKL